MRTTIVLLVIFRGGCLIKKNPRRDAGPDAAPDVAGRVPADAAPDVFAAEPDAGRSGQAPPPPPDAAAGRDAGPDRPADQRPSPAPDAAPDAPVPDASPPPPCQGAANGAPCGADRVCRDGTCVACMAGTACTPANPCHAGVTCAGGTPACADTGRALADGTGCGPDRVCRGGACGACKAGEPCAHPNACKRGVVSCATGAPVCTDGGDQPAGTTCGPGPSCTDGTRAAATACDGKGTCVPGAKTSCAPYGCSGNECATACPNYTCSPGCKRCNPALDAVQNGAIMCAADGNCSARCNMGYLRCDRCVGMACDGGQTATCEPDNWQFQTSTDGFVILPGATGVSGPLRSGSERAPATWGSSLVLPVDLVLNGP